MGGIDNRELRKLAEPYKSFPKAVAAVVRAIFDKGAINVCIHFEQHEESRRLSVYSNTSDNSRFSDAAFLEVQATGVHHCAELTVFYDSGFSTRVEFYALGEGQGVNPKQDRSATRLLRELPKFLSPREAFNTAVIDENGQSHALGQTLMTTSIDGFKIDWPVKLVGYSPDELVLKLGAVRVPMKTFLKRVGGLSDDHRRRLDILTHPWLAGVVEVRPDETVGIRIPTLPGVDFIDAFYISGQAQTLAMALLESDVYIVAQDEIGKVIESVIGGFTNSSGELVFWLGSYRVARLCPGTVAEEPGNPVLWWNKNSSEGVEELFLDVTHPVFRTVGPYDQEVMQVIWWQLAMWIAWHQPEVCGAITDPQARVTMIYLALRDQNPENWDV